MHTDTRQKICLTAPSSARDDVARHNEQHKQEQLKEQEEGKGKWKRELSSDSEGAVCFNYPPPFSSSSSFFFVCVSPERRSQRLKKQKKQKKKQKNSHPIIY